VISVILGLVAAVGYLQPKDTQAMPVRVLFDNNGGKVVFSHAAHSRDYGVACEECHHESDKPSPNPVPCGSCHPKVFDENFAKNHISAFADERYCERCHHEGFDGKNSEPCSSCHEEKIEALVPTELSAFHNGCMGCHKDLGSGPYQKEDCTKCHMK
jgi:DnaJ-class molecular chaperone